MRGGAVGYPNTVKSAITNKDLLRCNRRGIGSEKPSVSIEELLENSRWGTSYSSVDRKLAIDPSKDEVFNVYRAIRGRFRHTRHDSDTQDIEKEDVTVPKLKHYPTPLWFLWRSEADIIVRNAFPSWRVWELYMGTSSCIVTHLGGNASTKACCICRGQCDKSNNTMISSHQLYFGGSGYSPTT